ncbi:leucyl/phenylalanyl-tRNA--protein transferase [Kineococcus indalonis]|uniref:leucyl/phenylalanyl-tRNA--protein transferase n=1 Tax=Kineococcus indalonis TaxID=2696566 RepID=UPI002B1BD869|nr:leucyl/phenylalanyl-tRNA--protein transferase [Kineococcus indalonis]
MWAAPLPSAPAGPPRRHPGRARFAFERLAPRRGEDLVAAGGDLSPATLLAAYARGLFPMGLGGGGRGPLGWWSPDPRGVLLPERVHVSRSLRRALRGFEVRVDTAFDDVVAGCADPSRPGAWITGEVAAAYGELHRLGWAHSVEVWSGGELAGGLYGVALGGLFAAESKFHRERDASKAAVVALADLLLADGARGRLVDVQWRTEHLATLGVEEVDRPRYHRLLSAALALPVPAVFAARPDPPHSYDGG